MKTLLITLILASASLAFNIEEAHKIASSDTQARKTAFSSMYKTALPLLVTSKLVSVDKYTNTASQNAESLFLALEAGRKAKQVIKTKTNK
jgi:hypothetical protein